MMRDKVNMLSLLIAGKTLALDSKLNEGQLQTLFDSYNAASLQRLAAGRGLPTNSKKDLNIRSLARNFYDEKNIRQALQKLPKEGRMAMTRLVRLGDEDGTMPYAELKQQLTTRHDANFARAACAQLISSGLALFAFRRKNQLSFETTYTKHDIETPGGFVLPNTNSPADMQVVVWMPPQVRKLIEIDPQLDAQLQPVTLQPYAGKAEPQLKTSARFENLLADIFTFTRYVEQNKPKVLQSGQLGKRDFSKLATQVMLKDETSLQEARQLNDLPRLNFLWQVLLGAGLIEVHRASSQVRVSELLPVFYNLPRPEQIREIAKGWANSELNEFTRLTNLQFLTTDPAQSDIPTIQRQQQARQRLLKLWQQLFQANQLPFQAVGGDWLDFTSWLAVVKENAYELLIKHTHPSDKSNYGYYYASYLGNFGPGYYRGFIHKSKPPRADDKRAAYGYAGDHSRALSLDSDWEWVEGEWIAYLLGESLCWLGLTELGLDEKTQKPVAFRFSTAGQEFLTGQPSAQTQATEQQLVELAAHAPELARPLIVQPNFEVLVLSPLQNLPLLRQLDQFGVQASLGDVALYRINKESVLRGLRQGWESSAILKLLQENSRVPVAQNIETSLQDWGAAFERLILRPNSTLLEVGDPARLEKVLNTRPDLGLRRLGSHFALVAANKAGVAAQALAAADAPDPKKVKPISPTVINNAQIVRGTLSFQDAYTLQVETATPYQLYKLGQFTELVSWERATRRAVLKLTAAAVDRARQSGLNYKTIVDIYNNWLPASKATTPYPETDLALKGWLGEYGAASEIESEPAMLLQVSNSQILDDLFDIAPYSDWLLSRPSKNLALVKQTEFEALREALAKLNITFKEGVTYREPTAPSGFGLSPFGLSLPAGANANSFADILNNILAGRGGGGLLDFDDDDDDDFDDGDFGTGEDPDMITHLLIEMRSLLTELKPPGATDYMTYLTNQRFAQQLLNRVEIEGGNAKNRRDKYWNDKHEEAHYYADLTPSERREALTESALEAMTSTLQLERQAAVGLLSLVGTKVARDITQFLYHADPIVRYNAGLVLAEVGDRESLTHLQAVLNDHANTSLGTVAEAAEKAAGAIKRRLNV